MNINNNNLKFYKPELDVIRFVAFIMVFLFHVLPNEDYSNLGGTTGSYQKIIDSMMKSLGFGLCLFFFLSAYLITTLLLKENEVFGSINLKSFFIRRILRIWPLYFLGVSLGALITLVFHPEKMEAIKWYVLFISNFYYQNHSFGNLSMEHLWSISVEEQFYLIFPILIKFTGAVRVKIISLIFVGVSLISLFIQGANHLDLSTTIWTNSFANFLFFGTGIICAVFTKQHEIKYKLSLRIIFIILAFLLFLIASLFFKPFVNDYFASGLLLVSRYIFVALGCVFVLFSFLDNNLKMPKTFIYLGKISYGLYVWHYFNIYIIMGLIKKYEYGHDTLFKFLSIIPTVIMAIISYRYLELPFLKLKNKFTYIQNRKN